MTSLFLSIQAVSESNVNIINNNNNLNIKYISKQLRIGWNSINHHRRKYKVLIKGNMNCCLKNSSYFSWKKM